MGPGKGEHKVKYLSSGNVALCIMYYVALWVPLCQKECVSIGKSSQKYKKVQEILSAENN